MISLTSRAVSAIEEFIARSKNDVLGLRVKVEALACSGFKYSLSLVSHADLRDKLYRCEGLTLLVDSDSETLLKDAVMDFVDDDSGTGFKFDNPNTTKGCSCSGSC
ncbi:HesB/IscA family protein [Agaribacterium haliotis]|uniref:HesB/IscA family protein n=1 Tax=Agaribacterium haliotis TaxID=2013869 RepID=UPI000BB58C25|nr:iron-sulfur cluster assembly accessory protein [Agaribacterium haliotis]